MKNALNSTSLGIASILIAALFVVYIKCPTNAQYFLIYALVGIGTAMALYRSASNSRMTVRTKNISIVLAGGAVLPFALFFTNPIGRFKPDNCTLGQSLTVFVYGGNGPQDMVLRQKGYVVMDVNGERKKASINENGQAFFQNLREGDKARLDIDFTEPYKTVYPDSIYTIAAGSPVYLKVSLRGIENVRGKVMYNEQPLAQVLVQIDTLSTSTDINGNFSVPIPPKLQNDHYKVWFLKKGFKSKAAPAYPETGVPMEIIMEKVRPNAR